MPQLRFPTRFKTHKVGGGPAPLYCNSFSGWTRTGSHSCTLVALTTLIILVVTELLDLTDACTTRWITNMENGVIITSVVFTASFAGYLYIMSSRKWFSDEEVESMTLVSVGSVLFICGIAAFETVLAVRVINAQLLCGQLMVASYVRLGFSVAGTVCVALVSIVLLIKSLSEAFQQQQVLLSHF
eukprot:Blabericola_migrator_1__4125@NODE_225_length_11139_cov_51_682262_g191_i0_p7_GENE_NODE_225_length_11139_cov_51_682262_g191_i0NODE_225_length_11139_cov_51_682262_g191_i0_p7_ORF_typecomplete_len185_score17_61DUF373/PF04123_13/4_6e02DUF373/PF04123_13/0_015YdjM/PF04307_14/0_089_NODE_225_length_11139_cov_51_682262_g191_i032823836